MQRKKFRTHSATTATDRREKLKALLTLSHKLGDPAHPLAIPGEGNASARLSGETFLVKASGCSLGTLDKSGIVECRSNTLLPLLEKNNLSDAEVDGTVLNSRLDAGAKKLAANSILCSPRAREFSGKRIFPDEIVCCDVASVFIPYTDPGLKLAQAIREQTEEFLRNVGRPRASFSWKTMASSRWGDPSNPSCSRC